MNPKGEEDSDCRRLSLSVYRFTCLALDFRCPGLSPSPPRFTLLYHSRFFLFCLLFFFLLYLLFYCLLFSYYFSVFFSIDQFLYLPVLQNKHSPSFLFIVHVFKICFLWSGYDFKHISVEVCSRFDCFPLCSPSAVSKIHPVTVGVSDRCLEFRVTSWGVSRAPVVAIPHTWTVLPKGLCSPRGPVRALERQRLAR